MIINFDACNCFIYSTLYELRSRFIGFGDSRGLAIYYDTWAAEVRPIPSKGPFMKTTNDRIPSRLTTAVAAGIFLCLALAVSADFQGQAKQALQNPYLGQKLPGTTPQIFAPGIVSTDAHEFSCSFTPDGKEFYFSRSESLQSPTLIMVSKCVDGVWSPPAPAAFNDASGTRPGGGMSFEPVVTPDGRRLYFSSDRPVPGQPEPQGMPMLNIWYVEREGDRWSEPKCPGAPFNPMKTMIISMTRTGTIYTGDISAGMANNRIAVTRLKDRAYQPLEVLGASINVGPINNYPHVAPDESYLIFNRREKPGGPGGLFVSFRAPDGTWGESRLIDLGPLDAGLGMVSPDGKYLFFTAGERRKGDIYWVEATFLRK